MIPQSRIPTTPHHPLAPILPNAFLYPSFLLLLLTRKNPGNISKPRNSSRLPGLILSSVYPPKPAKFLFLSCTVRIFPKAPSFSPPSSEHPLSVFSPKTDTAFRSRPCARTGAEPLPSRLFLFPFPASAGSQVDGKWPFLRLRFPSALCLLQPAAGIPPLSSPFCGQNAPASPTAPCSPPKPLIPFSPLGNRFILLQNRSFFFFLRQNYEKLSGFN